MDLVNSVGNTALHVAHAFRTLPCIISVLCNTFVWGVGVGVGVGNCVGQLCG